MTSQAIHAIPAPVKEESPALTLRGMLAPLVAIVVGVFMVVLDSTATNVAIPTLVAQFHDPLSTVQWVITGYTLAMATAVPLAGWLAERFGPRPTLLVAITVFTLFSGLCAAAQGSGMLIAFRVMQGIGGGMVFPIGLAYVYRLAPPEKIGIVAAILGMPVLVAPALGPVLGGWLVQDVSWRWIFLVNVPIGVIAVLLGLLTMPAVARRAQTAFDLPGMILAPMAFACLVYGISEGATSWSSANTIGGLAAGTIALVSFIFAELHTENPLVELRVFGAPEFDVAMVAQWAGYATVFSGLFAVPLFLQQVRGYGALDTGLSLLPQVVAASVFLPLGGLLFNRLGARPLVVAGGAVMTIGCLWLATISNTTQGWDLIGPLAFFGAGAGLLVMPLMTQTFNTAPRALADSVSALTTASELVVASLVVALLSTLISSRSTMHVDAAKQVLAAHASQAQDPVYVQRLLSAAAAAAFDDTFHVVVAFTLAAAVLGLALRRVQAPSGTAQPGDAGAHN